MVGQSALAQDGTSFELSLLARNFNLARRRQAKSGAVTQAHSYEAQRLTILEAYDSDMRAKDALNKSRLTSGLRQKSIEQRAKLSSSYAAATARPSPRNDILPALVVVELPLADLNVPERRLRRGDAGQIQAVANAIAAFGFCQPVLIGKDNSVVDGATRIDAAKLLGLDRVPCLRVDHLNETEQRLLRLAVNRLGEKAQWDLGELKIEFEELVLLNAPITLSGFEISEIDQITLGSDDDILEQGNLEPATVTIARPGDLFRLGKHRLLCGDARNSDSLSRLLGDSVARLVLTDVPYNVPIKGNVTGGNHREFAMASGEMSEVEFEKFNSDWIAACLPHLVEGGLLGTFIDWRGYPTIHAAARALELEPLNLIAWVKSNAGMGSLWRSQHELLPMFKKGTAVHVNNVALGKHGRWRSNVWNYPGASTLGSDARAGLKVHPTVKPSALLRDALLDVTERGDVVLDPFAGSGSTFVAAEEANRVCFGVEIDPIFVDVIIRRFQEITSREVVLDETGETFESLEKRRAIETIEAD